MSVQIRAYRPSDEARVIELWKAGGLTRSWSDPRRDIERKRQVQPELLLVGEMDGTVVATVMAGYDGHRGWLNYLTVAPDHRNRGFARQLVEAAEQRLAALGCAKVNLQVRSSNQAVLGFYRSLGYADDDVVGWGKRLIRDEQPAPDSPSAVRGRPPEG
jgi:ribosomal protein S18 acetylase RimI-like enzyme